MSRTNPSKSQRNEAARAKAEQMRREAEARSRRNRNIIVGVTVAVVVVLFVAIAVAWQSASREAAQNAQGPGGLTDRGGMVVGQETAPVTVTVFSDFMCPACKSFEQENKAQLAELSAAGTVKVEYVPVTILDRFSEGTRFSTRAASAAYCVAGSDPQAFVAFHDSMFANQPAEGTPGLTSEEIATIAADAGVSQAGQDCITENRYTGFAEKATEMWSQAGHTGTPTVLVNEDKVQDWSAANVRALIEAGAGA